MSEANEGNPETQELDTAKLRSPEERTDEESTPLHDEMAAKATEGSVTTTTTVTTDVTQNEPSGQEASESTAEEDEPDIPDTANSYKVDVQRALSRETSDGKGDEDPGPSDWNGYATEGVEVDEKEGD